MCVLTWISVVLLSPDYVNELIDIIFAATTTLGTLSFIVNFLIILEGIERNRTLQSSDIDIS